MKKILLISLFLLTLSACKKKKMYFIVCHNIEQKHVNECDTAIEIKDKVDTIYIEYTNIHGEKIGLFGDIDVDTIYK